MKVDFYFDNFSIFSPINNGGTLTIQHFYCSSAKRKQMSNETSTRLVTECGTSLWEKRKKKNYYFFLRDSKSPASLLSTKERLVGLFVNKLGKKTPPHL